MYTHLNTSHHTHATCAHICIYAHTAQTHGHCHFFQEGKILRTLRNGCRHSAWKTGSKNNWCISLPVCLSVCLSVCLPLFIAPYPLFISGLNWDLTLTLALPFALTLSPSHTHMHTDPHAHTDRVNMRMAGIPESHFFAWAQKLIKCGWEIDGVEG